MKKKKKKKKIFIVMIRKYFFIMKIFTKIATGWYTTSEKKYCTTQMVILSGPQVYYEYYGIKSTNMD
jgi:hypothetical protein